MRLLDGSRLQIVEEFRRDVRILALRADVVVLAEAIEAALFRWEQERPRKSASLFAPLSCPTSQSPSSIIAARPARNRLKDCDWSIPINGFRKYLEVQRWSSSNAFVAHGSSAQLAFIVMSASCFSAPHSVSRISSMRRMTCQLTVPPKVKGGNSGLRELLRGRNEFVVSLRLGRDAGLLEKGLIVIDRLAVKGVWYAKLAARILLREAER